jgi:hypothetical protein
MDKPICPKVSMHQENILLRPKFKKISSVQIPIRVVPVSQNRSMIQISTKTKVVCTSEEITDTKAKTLNNHMAQEYR